MRRLLMMFMTLALVACSAQAQNIGLYFDLGGATCSATATPGTGTRMYIMASPGGGASTGITGVEFRVTGIPAGWFLSTVRNPASNVQFGDPFDGVGANAAFPVCQTAPLILLFTVDMLATTVVSNHYLRVERRNPPLNPNFICPVVTNCQSPIFPLFCATGGTAILNPTGPGCTVGVESSSWTRVKSLYERQ